MKRSKPPPPPSGASAPKLRDIEISPVLFEASLPVGSVIASVLVETAGEGFHGTLALTGPDADKFAVAEGLLWLTADVPPGNYEITVVAEQGTESLYSPQVLTSVGPDNVPGPEPEPPPTGNPDNTVRVASASGAAIVNYPLQFGRAFMPGEIAHYPQVLVDGVAVLSQADVKNRHADGSVKFAVLSLIIPTLPATDVLLTFRDTTRRGRRQVSEFTPSGGRGWAIADEFPGFDAEIRITGPAGTRTASARTMLLAGDYTVWAEGPVTTTVVCFDRSPGRVHDIGWSEHRPLHPWFVITFWPALHKAFIRYVGEISNTEALEAQTYDLELLAGDKTVYQQAAIAHRPATRWTRTGWYGGDVEIRVNIDHNLPYLAATKLVANYDPTIVIPESTIAAHYEAWLSTDRTIGGEGWWCKYMPTTGGRKDIGLSPSWCVAALLTGDWRYREIACVQANLAGAWPRQMREGDNSKANFGRTVTCHTRPTYWYLDGRAYPTVEDDVTIIAPGADDGWFADTAHQPDPFSVPYLITGDPYYLDGLEMWNGANSLSTNPGPGINGRGGGYFTAWGDGQVRAQGWLYRTLFNAAAFMPDTDPMRAEFERMVNDAIAKDEGQRSITGTSYENSERWKYGASALGTTGDGWGGLGPPPCRWWSGAAAYWATDPIYYSPDVCASANAHWMNMFVIMSLGRGRELGFPVDALLQWVGPHVIGQLTTPNYPPQLVSQYVVPDLKWMPDDSADWFPSWDEALFGWSAQKQTGILDGAIEIHYWGMASSYLTQARCACALVTHLPDGEVAWQELEFLIECKTVESGIAIDWSSDPTWSCVPR